MTKEETKSFVIKSALDCCMIKIDLSLTNEEDTEENVCLSMRSFEHSVKFSSMRTFILDSQKHEIDSGEFKCFFESGKGLTHLLKITNNMIMKNKDLYLYEDVLSLGFVIAISTGILYEGLENVEYSYATHLTTNEVVMDWRSFNAEGNSSDENSELKVDLISLYREKSLCDMKLKTKKNNFSVHTSILGARSPVFKAMFSSDMKENVNRCVDMSDLQDETVRRFLLYLYSDQLEDLKWDDALQLYKVADKYAVFSLVHKCSTFLKNNLNLENVCEALMHSDLHQDENFKEIAQNLILKNANTIFKSEEWKVLAVANPQLAVETMIRIWNDD
ncbi:TD and POZ domain-containing protein 4 [Argiope bruennichi]|uniref:TD and POZ domain-containing protein 4 n=1 Tax=Argiope bruennichi TaxID=94029 RepID=A0A8T0EF44_ARGBR|nr:TD and POZ domain-containing protein 4 [Argiope bruennichi]